MARTRARLVGVVIVGEIVSLLRFPPYLFSPALRNTPLKVTMERKPLEPDSPGARIVADEQALLARVEEAMARRGAEADEGPRPGIAYDQELIALRDQIAEARLEDQAPLVEQMARVAALAAGRKRETALPVDPGSPYFAHMRLREPEPGPPSPGPRPERVRDVLIGKRGYIDRAAGVQIVDWRDAPVSQIYYRYEEGDDYDETVDGRRLEGVVEARRNLTIHQARLRRIGCPGGVYVAGDTGAGETHWFEAEGLLTPTLQGGSGKAARPPRQTAPQGSRRERRDAKRLGVHSGPVPRADKQLPEIAALIDPEQFALVTAPSTGLVVIQGGAGSGKTTVALHRVAFLVFNDPQHVRPSRCLVVVPSPALERYVAGVLPALGVRGVPVVTFHGWARATRRKVLPKVTDKYASETPAIVSRVKKHPALLGLLAEAVAEEAVAARDELLAAAHEEATRGELERVWSGLGERAPLSRLQGVGRWLRSEAALALGAAERQRIELALQRGRRRLRDVRTLHAEVLSDEGRLRRALPSEGEDAVTPGQIAQVVAWVAAQQAEPDEVDDESRSGEADEYEAAARTPVDGGRLDDRDEEQAAGRLDIEDDALLLRLVQLTQGGLYRPGEREPITYDHIALDEAQDLSALEVAVLLETAARRGGSRSVTVCGDVAQRLVFDNAFRGWGAMLDDAGLGLRGVEVRPLRLSYRSTEEVMRFARAVLGPLAAEDEEVAARPGAPVELHAFDEMGEAVGFLAEALRSLAGREPTASVALLTRYPAQADAWHRALVRAEVPSLRRVRRQDFAFAPGIDVTDVTQVKGLEFDYVVLLDATAASYPPTIEARHLLHIGATRAAHQLWVVSVGQPSPLLPAEILVPLEAS